LEAITSAAQNTFGERTEWSDKGTGWCNHNV